MAIGANERQRGSVPLQDLDGRLIVVGPDGVPIAGSAGGGGADPLSDGSDAGALPTKTLWIAGADGTVLRGVRVDASGRLRTVLEGTPSVSVSNFPGSQLVSGPLTDVQLRASAVPVSGPVTDAQLRAAAVPVSGPLTDTQLRASAVGVSGPLTDIQLRASAVPVSDSRLPAALDADGGMKVHVQNPSAGGGGGTSQADKSAYTEGTTVFTPMGGVLNETITADPTEDQAAAARITPKRAVHSNLRNNSGAEIGIAAAPIRTDPTGTTVQPVSGTVTASGPLTDTQLRAAAVPVSGTFWQATQPVSLAAVPIVTEKQDQPAGTTATWTSATALNTALTTNTTGYGTANVSIQVPSTVTGGVITLEVSDDNTVWYPAGAVRVDNALQENVVTLALSPGQALNRMYTVSTDAQTQVRARLSTVITGAGNVVVRITLVAGGIEPFVAQRSRKVATYRAVYRTAARIYTLSKVLVANTRNQYATIHHAATATKTVRLRRVWVQIRDTTVAGNLIVDLVRITTAPATGNPVITPALADNSDSAAEVTCLALPTTAGTEAAAPYSQQYWNLGITGGAASTQPVPVNPWIDLLAATPGADDESKLPTIRAGVLEGWAVVFDVNQAMTITGYIMTEFTEEPA